MKKLISIVLASLFFTQTAYPAASRFTDTVVSGSSSVGTTSQANSKAVLDAVSTSKGALLPRMTIAQRDAIASPPEGLEIYNTDTHKKNVYNGTSWVEVGSGSGAGAANLISLNPDAEAGTTAWTASGGTFTTTTTAANVDAGAKSFSWDASGAQNVRSDAYPLTAGYYGANCLAAVNYQGGDTNLTLQVLDGSNNVLNSKTLATQTAYKFEYVDFICPSSGSVKIGLLAGADAAIVYFDTAFIGKNYLIGLVSPTTEWADYTPTFGAGFGTVTSIDFQWRRNGDTVEIQGKATTGTVTNSASDISLPSGLAADTGKVSVPSLVGYSTAYMTSGANTSNSAAIMLKGASSLSFSNVGDGGSINNLSDPGVSPVVSANSTVFSLYASVPISGWSAQSALKVDQSAQSWSGYHGTDCTWTTTAAGPADFAADGSCTFTELTNRNMGTVSSTGSKTLGITWTPNISGVCRAEVDTDIGSTSAGSNRTTLYLTDGSDNIKDQRSTTTAGSGEYFPVHLSGDFSVTAGTAYTVKIRGGTSGGTTGGVDTQGSSLTKWSVKCLDQGLNAPLLVNSMINGRSGVTRTVDARVDATCSASPCTIATQSGDFTDITRDGLGAYSANLTTAYSAAPTCTVQANDGYADLALCKIKQSTTTTNVVKVQCQKSSDASGIDSGFNLMCRGPR